MKKFKQNGCHNHSTYTHMLYPQLIQRKREDKPESNVGTFSPAKLKVPDLCASMHMFLLVCVGGLVCVCGWEDLVFVFFVFGSLVKRPLQHKLLHVVSPIKPGPSN